MVLWGAHILDTIIIRNCLDDTSQVTYLRAGIQLFNLLFAVSFSFRSFIEHMFSNM